MMILWQLLSLIAVLVQCNAAQCTGSEGCYPPLGELTLNRSFTVTSSCTDGDMYTFIGDTLACDSTLNSAFSINDDDFDTMWVSGIDGDLLLPLIVQLDFEGPVFFYSTNITWASRTPSAMSLERNNGSDWLPYRYYADNCMKYYNLTDSVVVPNEVFPDQEPVCTSLGLQILSPGAVIMFETASHLSNGTSEEDYNSYQLVHGLRIVVDEINEDSLFGPIANLVSISEWSAEGTCMCNGHASMCSPIEGEDVYPNKVYVGCLCSHNTNGTNCDECESGYNIREWLAGDESNANECLACQCNGHADDCYYDEIKMAAVCIDCQHNTEGDDCSSCQTSFYPDPLLPPMSENYCKACDCNMAGVIDNGECNVNGMCNCKANVISDKCTVCNTGYWNFTESNPDGCQLCDCGEGTLVLDGLKVCVSSNGLCLCEDNVVGNKCDACESGFYDPSNGCNKMCACNPIGSINMSCNATDGQCNCKENINGIICADTNEGYYYHTLDSIVFEAEETDSNLPVITPLLGKETFSGSGFLQVPSSGTTIIFTVEVPITSNYFIVVRYASSVDISGVLTVIGDKGYSFVLSSSETSEPSNGDFSDSIPISISLQENTQYEIMLSCFENEQSTDEWLLDSIILVPDIVRNSTYYETLVDTEKISILLCLPLSLPVIRDTFCDLTAFEFSIEFYGQVFLCEEPNLFGVEDPASECGPHGRDFTCNSNYTGSLCDQCANGYYNSSGLCEMCPSQCDAMGSFNEACDMQTGGCQCRSNVIGDTCNQCLDGTYNLTSNGCSDCNCSQYASSNECDDDGVCACPDNIAQPKCEECQDGYYNISVNGCTVCGCNPEASVSDTCDEVTGQCNCTENAIGLQCMDCPATHYQTAGISQDYCTQCICFGLSTSCVGDNDNYILTTIESDFGTVCGNTIDINICAMNWAIMDVSFTFPSSDGLLYFIYNGENPTFIAPEMYHGDFKLSYGHSLTIVFIFRSEPDSTNSAYIKISSSKNSLYSPYPSPSVNGDRYTFTIPFIESYWRIGSIDGPVASISDLINVLADVNDFTFTGKFGSDIIQENNLNFVSWPHILTTSEGSGSGDELFSNLMQHTVQSCNCSPGHKGQFCEECTMGYYSTIDCLTEPCIECDCNNLSVSCDTPSGNCTNCTGNSQGSNCEKCMPGYYGDPTNAISCVECDCNNRSMTCNSDGVCDNCDEGYRGDNCDVCDNGYHNASGSCELCSCDNVDASIDPFCDPVSGQCLNCIDNTEGFNCDTCITGYYNNGLGCQLCNCDTNGALPEICDNNGTCLCKDNTNDDCSECLEGYYGNVTNNENCLGCPCPTANNTHAASCSVDTNNNMTICMCNEAYTGPNCEECSEGYFGDALNGICNDCTCNGNFDEALGSICDMTTGFCMNCTNNTFGAECENCDNGYSGDPISNIPCTSCSSCSINGTIPEICGMVSGMCLCKENVTGVNCNKCINGTYGAPDQLIDCRPCPCENIDNPICSLHNMSGAICENCGPAYEGQHCENCANGYYRDQNNACVECECYGNVDPQLGLTCDPDNGTCLNCLNNTTGPNCNECITGYYGDIPNGIPCQKCDCNMMGTTEDVCDSKNGTCFCLPNTTPDNCDGCVAHFWGFSTECKPCNCCGNGSESLECNQTTGQCPCKNGVGGMQCCNCESRYYDLTEAGCKACECSDLAESVACNSTGHCECKDGAIGEKCDECSFGYVGTAPNCSRCHDCFFSWNEIINDLSMNAGALLIRVQQVLDYYKSSDVDYIENTVDSVENTLNDVMQTLKTVSVDAELLTIIDVVLQEVNSTYLKLYADQQVLSNTLFLTGEILNNVTSFVSAMGSQLNNLEEISQNISEIFAMIEILKSQATSSFETTVKNQKEIIVLHANAKSLLNDTTMADQVLLEAIYNSNFSIELVQMTNSIAKELSPIKTTLALAEKKVDIFQTGILDGMIDMEEIAAELEILDETLATFNLQLKSISMLSEVLENATTRVKEQVQYLSDNIKIITNSSHDAYIAAEKLMEQIYFTQDQTSVVASNFSTAQGLSSILNEIQAPSTGEAIDVAVAINSTMLEEEEVNGVLSDANDTITRAKDYLNRVQKASQDVQELETLVEKIGSDVVQINESLTETDQYLVDTSQDNSNAESYLTKVNEDLSASSDDVKFKDAVSETETKLESGMNKLDQLKTEVERAEKDSKALKTIINQENNELQSQVTLLNQLAKNATRKDNATSQTMERANAAKDYANQSKDKATKSPPAKEDLTNLLKMYKERVINVNNARAKLEALNQDLEGLAVSFNEAAKKYKNCYKTP